MTQINQPSKVVGRISGFANDETPETVRAGEQSLADVARRLGVPLEELQAANPHLAAMTLQQGTQVRVPSKFQSALKGEDTVQPQVVSSAPQRSAEQMLEASMRRQQIQPAATQPAAQQIPPYDPAVGPLISPDMWTAEMLTGPMTADLLRNQKEPAKFLNTRKALLQQPTDARVVSNYDGTVTPVNPEQMSSIQQAESLRARLLAMGLPAPSVTERPLAEGGFRTEYGSDPRRHFFVGEMNAGLLALRYAMYPVETADEMTRVDMLRMGITNTYET